MMAVLCLGPMVIMMLYEFKLLALVINQGFLAQAHVLGVADFIYLHTALMGVIMIIYKDWLIKNAPFLPINENSTSIFTFVIYFIT